MSALESAVTELRNSKTALTTAENESSRIEHEKRAADDVLSLAQQRYNSARISLADAALVEE